MVKEVKKNDVEKDIVKVNELNKGDRFSELSSKYKNLQKRIEKVLGSYNDKKEEKRRILNEEKIARLASATEKKAKPLPEPVNQPVSDNRDAVSSAIRSETEQPTVRTESVSTTEKTETKTEKSEQKTETA